MITRRECLKIIAGGVGSAALSGLAFSCASRMPAKLGPRVALGAFDDKQHTAKATAEAIRTLGGFDKLIRPGDLVCLKPNLVADTGDNRGVVTDPQVIEGLIQAVIDCRGKPVVMEATCGGRFPTTKFAEKLGIIKICRKYDVEFVDLNNDEEISKQVPEPAIFDRLTLSRRPLECDRLISIPVLKTHFNAGVSLGMKNYVGLLGRRAYAGNRGYTRGRFHNFARISLQHKKRVNQRKDLSSRHSKRFPSESLNLATVDLVAVRPPDAVVISAVYGLESQGPVPGSPVDIKQRTGQYMVVAGYDPVAVDRIGADLMGASDDIARVLPLAAARGLGEMDREKIEIVGASFDELRCKFRMAFFID